MIRQFYQEDVSEAAVEFELRRLIQFYSQHMSEQQIKANMTALRKQAKEQAIGVRLLIRESRRQNLPVADKEVDEVFQQIIEQAGGKEGFEAMLKKQNVDEQLLRESLKDSKRVDMLIRKITADTPKPTPTELREYYDEHKSEFQSQERRRVQHILIKPVSDDAVTKEKVLARLEDLRKQFTAGSDFSDLAAAHSECPSGKTAGGSIGWVVRGMLAPAFDTAVFSTAVGQISDVVETPLGLHLVLPTVAEPGGTIEFKDAKKRIHELLMHSRRGKAVSAFVDTLKNTNAE